MCSHSDCDPDDAERKHVWVEVHLDQLIRFVCRQRSLKPIQRAQVKDKARKLDDGQQQNSDIYRWWSWRWCRLIGRKRRDRVGVLVVKQGAVACDYWHTLAHARGWLNEREACRYQGNELLWSSMLRNPFKVLELPDRHAKWWDQWRAYWRPSWNPEV